MRNASGLGRNYTIPSNNRELQLMVEVNKRIFIIPYQVITGSYNVFIVILMSMVIIPYQVITGSYNMKGLGITKYLLYHTK